MMQLPTMILMELLAMFIVKMSVGKEMTGQKEWLAQSDFSWNIYSLSGGVQKWADETLPMYSSFISYTFCSMFTQLSMNGSLIV